MLAVLVPPNSLRVFGKGGIPWSPVWAARAPFSWSSSGIRGLKLVSTGLLPIKKWQSPGGVAGVGLWGWGSGFWPWCPNFGSGQGEVDGMPTGSISFRPDLNRKMFRRRSDMLSWSPGLGVSTQGSDKEKQSTPRHRVPRSQFWESIIFHSFGNLEKINLH